MNFHNIFYLTQHIQILPLHHVIIIQLHSLFLVSSFCNPVCTVPLHHISIWTSTFQVLDHPTYWTAQIDTSGARGGSGAAPKVARYRGSLSTTIC